MNTLFISTYSKYIIIALLKDDKLVDCKIKESFNSHSVYTMPMIKEILSENNIDKKNLNQIEVVNGPGSFTGVRIGVTIAKTLAFTLNIPIKTISSIHSLALSTIPMKKVVTIRDIKGVYYGVFDENNEILEPLNYLNNTEFKEYINKNNYQDILIENVEKLNVENIHKYLKNINPTISQQVNPLDRKKIEAEK